jgi:zinc finger FYVE domain-containing protein 26
MQLLSEFPSLRDNHLILTYAAKAITVSAYPYTERRSSMAPVTSKQNPRTSVPAKSNFSNSLSNLQKEARRAFSWTSRDSGNKIAPKEMNRKRKSSGLPPSQRVAWEAMAGIQEDRISLPAIDGQERLPSVTMAEGWVLTGDPLKDEGVRLSHRYESAPDIILFKVHRTSLSLQ